MENSNDFQAAFKTIRAKRPTLDLLNSYVEGGQPLRYSTRRLKEAFDKIDVRFEINWCSVVVDTTLDRLGLNGFDTEDKAANDTLDEIFDKLHIDLEADKAHHAALSMTDAYIIVWKDGDNIEVYYNDPRMVHVFYDSAHPTVKSYAAKWFTRDDTKQQITLYYTDRIEQYISRGNKEINNEKDFELKETEENTFGVIPVFQLKTRGEIVKITSIQDAINKLFADMMVASEFGAFAQRYVISNSDPGNLKNAPNEIWWIPSGDGMGQGSSVGQFTSTDLKNYLDAMATLASDIAIITRTPKHYLMNTGSNISGEALLAMESPLVKKAEKHKRRFNAAWQDVAQFILQLDGITVDATSIVPVWDRVESVQPKAEAETRQVSFNTGIPLITLLRREGWTEQEIKMLEEDIAKEKESNRTLAQSVLDNLRVKDEQGAENGN
jgi:hypothetical protein